MFYVFVSLCLCVCLFVFSWVFVSVGIVERRVLAFLPVCGYRLSARVRFLRVFGAREFTEFVACCMCVLNMVALFVLAHVLVPSPSQVLTSVLKQFRL